MSPYNLLPAAAADTLPTARQLTTSADAPALSLHSRFVQRIQRRYPALLDTLPTGTPDAAWINTLYQEVLAQHFPDPAIAMRVTRHLTICRLCQLDCDAQLPLQYVMTGMSDLAEFCIAQAFQIAQRQCLSAYGALHGDAKLWVVGMGKLGARELNVSSDIDLIFVYDQEGETAGGRAGSDQATTRVSHQAFFTQQVQLMQALLAQPHEHGFVFRVDLALRPFGRDGALAISLPRLTQYFQQTGREWERFAWLKSRVLPIAIRGGDRASKEAEAAAAQRAGVLPLRAVVRGFVLRRFLDHKVFVALRELHGMIRRNNSPEQTRRDVKLGRGGIREIEFAAQVLQIVRGGRQPELLARPTLSSLQRLCQVGLMDEDMAQSLSMAYEFLRCVEHRIQYLDDQQTHMLPVAADDADWLARSMGFATPASFQSALNLHRDTVAHAFELWTRQDASQKKTTVTAQDLQTKAPWTVQYLRKHPDVLDELQRPDLLASRFDPGQFKQRISSRYRALQATGLGDEEATLDLLRRAHHIEVFRILVRDVQGLLSVRDVGDELSALADSMLELVLPWCWARIPKAHRPDPQLAIVAYGKLGGKELGYGSDLDIVFLYDDEHELAAQNYVALVRKLINWMTVKTGEGDLFEIDTALRPNGNSGLLVTSIQSYETYQLQRGSNVAWTWELQAMTRARCAVGSTAMRMQFDAIRTQVLMAKRDPQTLRLEIKAMRDKLRLAHFAPTTAKAPVAMFDIKHSSGGMVDVEFAVQALVLLHARDFPDLVGNVGNIELLKIAVAQGLIAADIGLPAADAYQFLRDKQHAARLQEVKAQLPADQCAPEQDAVHTLWAAVFDQIEMRDSNTQ